MKIQNSAMKVKISYSPQRGKPEGWGGKKKPPRHIRICHPSIEGNLPLIPLSEGCPYGGVEERNHPDMY
jgi:hypothetical protein